MPDRQAAVHDAVRSGLVERLPAAVYVAQCGVDGQWIFVSPQIEDILGFTPEHFLADAGLWARLLHPDDSSWVLSDEERDANGSGRERVRYEYRMIHKDGHVVWVLDDLTLIPDPVHGTLEHGLLYDISHRKQTELLLAEHADIVERVARGDDLLPTLASLAASTQSLTGATSCTILVDDTGAPSGRLAVCADGRVDADDIRDVDRIVPFEDSTGAPLGSLLLQGDDVWRTGTSGGDADPARWAARLASIVVGRALQDERSKTSYSLLQATLESTADGILVVDASGRIAGHNSKFTEMWRIPAELIDSGDDSRLIGFVLQQLADPDGFVAEVQRLYASPEQPSHDVLEFTDGRVFERYSQPQRVDGRSVGRVWSFRDMTSHRRLEDKLRHQAHVDSLTGLPNRHLLMERLAEALDRPRSASPLALLLLDVDDFKTVNDGLGHTAGDVLLVGMARRLASSVRSSDTAARLGGDEFVVLVESAANPAEVTALAERLLVLMSEPLDIDGNLVPVRVSIGIALAEPDSSAVDLLRNADLAMYAAKRDGGAGHRLYAAAMHADAKARHGLKSDLVHAMARGELSLRYQPVWDLRSLHVTGFEALVRWQHPQRGPVSPAEFIPIAEETGLIHAIGRWVLAQACAEAELWRELTGPGAAPTVSVNLSPRQMSNPLLVDEVRDVLALTGLPPSAMFLEITEGALAQSNVDVVGVLTAIKGLGAGLALDDFGTGYSSLGRLGNYPLDIVKLDKSFVDRLVDDVSSTALVEAILRLATALGLDVVAEGIETNEQLDVLRGLHCAKGQGYLVSAPLEAETVRRMLTSAGARSAEPGDATGVAA